MSNERVVLEKNRPEFAAKKRGKAFLARNEGNAVMIVLLDVNLTLFQDVLIVMKDMGRASWRWYARFLHLFVQRMTRALRDH